MYGWIWRCLPGRWPVKLALGLMLLVGVLALLWFVAFPIAEQRLPLNDVTVNSPAAAPQSP